MNNITLKIDGVKMTHGEATRYFRRMRNLYDDAQAELRDVLQLNRRGERVAKKETEAGRTEDGSSIRDGNDKHVKAALRDLSKTVDAPTTLADIRKKTLSTVYNFEAHAWIIVPAVPEAATRDETGFPPFLFNLIDTDGDNAVSAADMILYYNSL